MKSIFVYMNVVLAKNRTLYNHILNLKKEDQNVPESRSRMLRVGCVDAFPGNAPPHTHWLLCSLLQILKWSKCASHHTSSADKILCRTNSCPSLLVCLWVWKVTDLETQLASVDLKAGECNDKPGCREKPGLVLVHVHINTHTHTHTHACTEALTCSSTHAFSLICPSSHAWRKKGSQSTCHHKINATDVSEHYVLALLSPNNIWPVCKWPFLIPV